MLSKRLVALLTVSVVLCCSINIINSQQDEEAEDDTDSVEQDIEYDKVNNVVTIRTTEGPDAGMYLAIDYDKSIFGIYDPQTSKCYAIGGIPSIIPSLETLLDNENSEQTQSSKDDILFTYQEAVDRPIKDQQVLPYTLQSKCEGLPTMWMEPIIQETGVQTKPFSVLTTIGITIGVKVVAKGIKKIFKKIG